MGLGSFVFVGVTYIVAEYVAYLALAAFLGEAVGLVIVGVCVLGGLITYVMSLKDAVVARNPLWVADHFLAPAAATWFTVLLFRPTVRLMSRVIHLQSTLGHAHVAVILGPVAALALGLFGICYIFGAPVIAVMAMSSERFSVRLWSYAGFIATASYFGVLALVFIKYPNYNGGYLPACQCSLTA